MWLRSYLARKLPLYTQKKLAFNPRPRLKKETVTFDHNHVISWGLHSYGESFDNAYLILNNEQQWLPSYLVDTWHCINPACDCTEIWIDFLEINLTTNEVIDCHAVVTYDTSTRKWSIDEQKTGIDVHHLMDTLATLIKNHNYNIQDVFAQRHTYFNEVYMDYIQKDTNTLQAFTDSVLHASNTDFDDIFWSTTTIPVERDSPKVKRNTLCPCGSWKKYKKCCL